MTELPAAAQVGLGGQQAQRSQHGVQVTLSHRLARLLKIPPILQVKVAVEIFRALQRQLHFWLRARRSPRALFANSRNSPSENGACGPFTAFNSSASNSGLSSSRFGSARGSRATCLSPSVSTINSPRHA